MFYEDKLQVARRWEVADFYQVQGSEEAQLVFPGTNKVLQSLHQRSF